MKRFIFLLIILCLCSFAQAADTGYNWGAWAFVADADPSDWDDEALADNATETSGTAISLDGKAACIIGIIAYEDNTGAIDGVVTVYVLGETGGGYEETTTGSPYLFTFTPVQNDTVYLQFAIDPKYYDNFKIAIKNEGGQALAMDVRYKTATIPAAS